MKLKTGKSQGIPAWTDELLRQLGKQEDDQGLTSREIADRLAVCESVARRFIRGAIQQGRLEACKKRIKKISGETMLVAAYRPVAGNQT